MLFAQGPGAGPPPVAVWVAMFIGCACWLIIPAAYLLVAGFFSRTVFRVLRLCHPDTRALAPGLAWLNVIPCFNDVWLVITVVQVANSLQQEFADRQLDEEETDYGRTLGLALGIIGLAKWVVPNMIGFIDPTLGWVGALAALVMWLSWLVLFVLYWVRLAGYGRQLADDDDLHARAADEDDRSPPPEEFDDDDPR